jgi:hypothetical protein
VYAWLCNFCQIHALLVSRGIQPHLQKLDNEASIALQEFWIECNIQFQFVAPHVHHANAAKWVICTFMNHFIAGLSSADQNFPLSLWCHLVNQAYITLNLLQASRINPQLLTYAHLLVPSTTIPPHSHCMEFKSLRTKSLALEDYGPHMVKMVGMFTLQCNTIIVTWFM